MMGRRLVRLIWQWAPPLGLLAWAIHLYRIVSNYAWPAFGPIDSYVAHYRATLMAQLPVGLALLSWWVISFVRVRGRRSISSAGASTKHDPKRHSLGS